MEPSIPIQRKEIDRAQKSVSKGGFADLPVRRKPSISESLAFYVLFFLHCIVGGYVQPLPDSLHFVSPITPVL